MPASDRQPSDSRPRVLVVGDGALRRLRLPRALRRAGLDAADAIDPLHAGAELRRRRWDLVVWAARREDLARELVRAGGPPVVLVLDATRGVAELVSALDAGFADVLRTDSVPELVARAAAVLRRERARRAAEDSAAGLRGLAGSSRDLLARIAPDGALLFVSAAAREILGRDPERMAGTGVLELCHPDEREALATAMAGDGPSLVAHRMRRLSAGWVWMETTVSPVRDPTGRLVEVRIDARDVTERRRAEAERAGLARVTAAVASSAGVAEVAALACREAATAIGVETAAVARLHGDEAVVVAAAGPGARPGDRIPLAPRAPGRVVAPIRLGPRLWGVITAEGAGQEAAARLAPHADLVALSVANARARERLLALAHTDPLTGLANGRAFRERLASDCARAARSGAPLSLVLVDLDRFKRINDTWGHQAGDAVLRKVGGIMVVCARRGDLPARIGGEELAWLLPETDLEDAMGAAERLRRAIREAPMPEVGRVTASFGVAQLGAEGGDDLLRRADAALYRAKDGGRDMCVAAEAATASPTG